MTEIQLIYVDKLKLKFFGLVSSSRTNVVTTYNPLASRMKNTSKTRIAPHVHIYTFYEFPFYFLSFHKIIQTIFVTLLCHTCAMFHRVTLFSLIRIKTCNFAFRLIVIAYALRIIKPLQALNLT